MSARLPVVLVLVLLASGCDSLDRAKGGDSPPTPEEKSVATEVWSPGSNTPPPPAAPPAGSWLAFASEERGFKVEFPSSPRTETTSVPIGDLTVQMVSFSAELDEVYYMVATTDFPQEIVTSTPAASLLDGARDGAVANIGGKLKEEKQIEVDGNPARRIVITGNSGGQELLIDSVIFLKGQRLYQGIVVRPAARQVSTEVSRFLDSLHPV